MEESAPTISRKEGSGGLGAKQSGELMEDSTVKVNYIDNKRPSSNNTPSRTTSSAHT